MTDTGETTSPLTPVSPSEPPSSPRRRHPLDRPLLVGGVVLGVAAVVLIVLGLLASSSASSARDEADRLGKERRAAEAREIAAEGDVTTVVDEGNKVGDQIDKETAAANQVTHKNDELETLFDRAVDQFNAGSESSANATVDNQGRQLVSDEQGLKAQENAAVLEARDAQNRLREALAG